MIDEKQKNNGPTVGNFIIGKLPLYSLRLGKSMGEGTFGKVKLGTHI